MCAVPWRKASRLQGPGGLDQGLAMQISGCPPPAVKSAGGAGRADCTQTLYTRPSMAQAALWMEAGDSLQHPHTAGIHEEEWEHPIATPHVQRPCVQDPMYNVCVQDPVCSVLCWTPCALSVCDHMCSVLYMISHPVLVCRIPCTVFVCKIL